MGEPLSFVVTIAVICHIWTSICSSNDIIAIVAIVAIVIVIVMIDTCITFVEHMSWLIISYFSTLYNRYSFEHRILNFSVVMLIRDNELTIIWYFSFNSTALLFVFFEKLSALGLHAWVWDGFWFATWLHWILGGCLVYIYIQILFIYFSEYV